MGDAPRVRFVKLRPGAQTPRYMSSGSAHGLDEGARGSKEAFLVGVEYSNQGDFRQVKPFT